MHISAFDQRKAALLEAIHTNDRSVKQSIDTHALPIVNLINNHPHYVTTSRYSIYFYPTVIIIVM